MSVAKQLKAFSEALKQHDLANPDHTAYGIGMCYFDIERLGLEEGEEILPGITLVIDSGTSGNFRVLCDGTHEETESIVQTTAVTHAH